MSASDPNSAIFMTDTEERVRIKVNDYAFSGGKDTLKEHREKGANLEVDIPYQYLNIFCFDDQKLERLGREYGSGQMLSSEIKEELVKTLVPLIKQHQHVRESVTDDVVRAFMSPRKLEFGRLLSSKVCSNNHEKIIHENTDHLNLF